MKRKMQKKTPQYPKNYIKELRAARGLTLKKLADAVGVTNPYISMIELGKRGISWKMLRKLATALDCHPLDITEGRKNRLEASTKNEKEVFKLYRALSSDYQNIALHMLRTLDAQQNNTPVNTDSPAPKKRGWPKGKKRGPRKAKIATEKTTAKRKPGRPLKSTAAKAGISPLQAPKKRGWPKGKKRGPRKPRFVG